MANDEGASLLAQLWSVANSDLDIALGDLRRSTGLRPTVTIVERDGFLLMRYESDHVISECSLELSSPDEPRALVQVADHLQGEVMDDLRRAWPVCPDHDFGTHAREHDGVAVWWCEHPGHVVARIGGFNDDQNAPGN